MFRFKLVRRVYAVVLAGIGIFSHLWSFIKGIAWAIKEGLPITRATIVRSAKYTILRYKFYVRGKFDWANHYGSIEYLGDILRLINEIEP